MFDRAKIMQAAWKMVRRAGTREALRVRLSHALRNAWQDAKEQALVARQTTARFARFAAMSLDQLRTALTMTESADRLGHAGLRDLADLHRALSDAQRPALST
jgi:hypothetical protein